MNELLTTEELRTALRSHLDEVTPPPGDLAAVRRRSRASKVRRVAGPALLTAAAVGVGALVLSQTTGPGSPEPPDDEVVASQGPVDLTDGLRAYAAPDQKLYMGGRELPFEDAGLDTGAAATPYGIVAYDDDGLPFLLEPDGQRTQLYDGPSEPLDDFDPTVAAEGRRPHVAFAVMAGDAVVLSVYDLDRRKVVDTTEITCPGGCEDLAIDGIDSGAVFVRLSSGTSIWDYDRLESYRFAGPDTRVADVRNGVVLYDGPPPTENTEEWRLVPGAIDAHLSFDGEHVLYWSDELEPTSPDGNPIVLDLPVPATFFGFDTDGSVLAATVSDPVEVYDCELPSGRCELVGEMSAEHGDPILIGNEG